MPENNLARTQKTLKRQLKAYGVKSEHVNLVLNAAKGRQVGARTLAQVYLEARTQVAQRSRVSAYVAGVLAEAQHVRKRLRTATGDRPHLIPEARHAAYCRNVPMDVVLDALANGVETASKIERHYLNIKAAEDGRLNGQTRGQYAKYAESVDVNRHSLLVQAGIPARHVEWVVACWQHAPNVALEAVADAFISMPSGPVEARKKILKAMLTESKTQREKIRQAAGDDAAKAYLIRFAIHHRDLPRDGVLLAAQEGRDSVLSIQNFCRRMQATVQRRGSA